MFNKIPLSRKDLIHLYSNFNDQSKDVIFSDIDPSICAKIRDLVNFNKASFLPLLGQNTKEKNIRFGNGFVRWIQPADAGRLLEAAGLNNFSLKEPCEKRINFVEEKIDKLIDIFPDEIVFIVDFTSSIFWLQAESDEFIGSAAFYEIPHGTFLSDLAMFSIPPEVIVPKQFAEYAIFENLYHEALHHQMHAFSVLSVDGYLLNSLKPTPNISLSWRNRNFTLLEAIHALHIYSLVTPLRIKFFKRVKDASNDTVNLLWIQNAYIDGLRMWKELGEILMSYKCYLKDPWPEFISLWDKKYNDFVLLHNIVEEL
ncbi:MAG: hypothetical protein ACYC0J_08250 [Gammaproteobacteria bacterium]